MEVMKKAFARPDRERKDWLNLNGEWEFSFDKPIYDKRINVPFSWASPLSGINETRNGEAFYRRSVNWETKSERVFLCFGAVDYECIVYVNDKRVGEHIGGYVGFDIDITDAWERGKDNVISLAVKDPGKGENLYAKQSYGNICGIWQTVWLEGRAKAYIEGFFVKTHMDGNVEYEINTVGAADGDLIELCFDGIKASAEVKSNKASARLFFENPRLWSPEEPYLYEGKISLGGDVLYTYFGIREIGTGVFGENKNKYITLNGKPYYLNGVLDQAFNPKGYFTYPSDEDCRTEVERLKLIGINMMRIHIKAEEPLKLYWADKLGMLVMEDIPNFWSEPTPYAKEHYEIEMEEQMRRDYNHPSVFYWAIFNESWGLFTNEERADATVERVYKKDTADWVASMYHKAKKIDTTRLVEDNSTNCRDHTLCDVNSWHFYSNGYENVKAEIGGFCDKSYVGSEFNFREGYTVPDVPCINSECGNMWGIKGNAGDSDLSWQYKYMMNEFRLHDKIGGFVFTEYHDVPNEFNGYFKIDSSDKDFGYSEYEMSFSDLHSQDYVGADFAPMVTVSGGEHIDVALFASSFSHKYHGKKLCLEWRFDVKNPLLENGGFCADKGKRELLWGGYGTKQIEPLHIVMPNTDGVAILSWTLFDGSERIMRNCTFFDICKPTDEVLSKEVSEFDGRGFKRVIPAINGAKKSGLGSGSFFMTVNTKDIPHIEKANGLRLMFEASTRFAMSHDFGGEADTEKTDIDFMLGYTRDPGENPNSFTQTDIKKYSGELSVYVDDTACGTVQLADCPADCRGLLSHHYQPADDLLDETGSYGYLCDIDLPSDVFMRIRNKERFTVEFKTESGNGLSIYGRKSGRYPIGVIFAARK